MYKKVILPVILIVIFFGVIVFLVGIKESIQLSISSTNNKDNLSVEVQDSDVVENDNISAKRQILMLGDSIGLGSGDKDGLDIGSYYKRIQTKYDQELIEIVNLSVNGAKVEDLLKQIKREETSKLIKNSKLIIISIGGNDMKTILESSNLNLLIDYQALAQMYEETIKEILKSIKKLNPEVQIVMIGLYNPYGENIPTEKIQILLNWNHLTRSIIENYNEVAYIGTYELFKEHLDEYLAIDAFHPNALGYKTISQALVLVVDGLTE